MEPGRVCIARNRDVGASRILHQGPQLWSRERGVHQRCRCTDARRCEHRCDGK